MDSKQIEGGAKTNHIIQLLLSSSELECGLNVFILFQIFQFSMGGDIGGTLELSSESTYAKTYTCIQDSNLEKPSSFL